jgi:hypothetical protein
MSAKKEKFNVVFLNLDCIFSRDNIIRSILQSKSKKAAREIVIDKRVRLLSKLCDKTSSRVVVISSDREIAFNEYNDINIKGKENSIEYIILTEAFKDYGVYLYDVTPKACGDKLLNGVLSYLSYYSNNINNFVVLDDIRNDKDYSVLGDHLVNTCNKYYSKITNKWYYINRLKRSNIFTAYKKLNSKLR